MPAWSGCGIDHVEEFLELFGLSVQSVQVPDDHRVQLPGGDDGQETPVLLARLAAVCADVVVGVAVYDDPTFAMRQVCAVGKRRAMSPGQVFHVPRCLGEADSNGAPAALENLTDAT